MLVIRYMIIVMAVLVGGDSFAQLIELRQRCEEDNLFPDQSLERFKWLERCHPDVLVNFHDSLFPEFRSDPDSLKIEILADEWLYTRGRLRDRPRYMTFGLADHSNPFGWKAPIVRNAACGIPTGYIPLGLCTSSCYHPSQLVLFEQGDVPIIDAYQGLFDRIITLSEGAKIDDLQYTNRSVESFTSSIRDTHHQLVHLTMKSGGELKITQNHPMLTSDGLMVEAGDLKLGDSLLSQFGEADPIVAKEDFPYFGKVYNVSPHSNTREGHILVAEGYLTGSSWYQNDGVENLNRSILRRSIPDEILDQLED